LDLVKAWGAGLLAYVLGSLIAAAVTIGSGAGDRLTSANGALLWVALPALIAFLVITVLADLAHAAAPGHRTPGRRAMAVLTVPVLAILLGIAAGLVQSSGTLGVVTSALASVAGTALGYFAPALWRRRGGLRS
jgi:hypothetical protein